MFYKTKNKETGECFINCVEKSMKKSSELSTLNQYCECLYH